MNKKDKDKLIIELQTKLAELEGAEADDTEAEEYSLTEADLKQLIAEGVKEYATTAPKGQPGLIPNPDKKVGQAMHRVLKMNK